MTPQERASCEMQADRCRRRGELAQALALYQRLLGAFPGDTSLRAKLSLLGEMLQPAELQHPLAQPAVTSPAGFATLEEEAEYQAGRGDYATAASLYRRALRERPQSELLQERLEQLFELARQTGARPVPPSSRARPPDPEGQLQRLLERVSSRRRA